ncbi:hypothetical protein [Shewanella sp. SM95]|uniref:hypothetical protein n=1 Tax=Shewanella sp. SM95 TaxID=2912812 RepID=UPI0021DAD602|nr:hypothetical protein [Shewanella sp. SM95]
MTNWQLDIDVVRQGLLIENQGVKPHDFDFALKAIKPSLDKPPCRNHDKYPAL